MQTILILTKNLLGDQKLQDELQRLGYEVFCSANLLHKILHNEDVTQLLHQYAVIILSNTISNQEIDTLHSTEYFTDKPLIRSFFEEPSKEEKEQIKLLGITDWLTSDSSSNSIREKVAFYSKQGMDTTDYLTEKEKRRQLENHLTKTERRVFNCFKSGDDNVISREELCNLVWNEPQSNSRLAQLSLIISRINKKATEVSQAENRMIETVWGRGYRLETGNTSID